MPIPAAYGSARQQKKKQRPSPTYTGTPFALTQGDTVNIIPTVKGDAPTSSSISPALPSGLTLNSDLSITGTADEASEQTTYTVTATNSGGSTDAQFQLEVAAGAPTITLSQITYTSQGAGTSGAISIPAEDILSVVVSNSATDWNAPTDTIGYQLSEAEPQMILTECDLKFDWANGSADILPADGACLAKVKMGWGGKQPPQGSQIWIWDAASQEAISMPAAGPDTTEFVFENLNRSQLFDRGTGGIQMFAMGNLGHYVQYDPAAVDAPLMLSYTVEVRLDDGTWLTATNNQQMVQWNNEEPAQGSIKRYLSAPAPPPPVEMPIVGIRIITYSAYDSDTYGVPAPAWGVQSGETSPSGVIPAVNRRITEVNAENGWEVPESSLAQFLMPTEEGMETMWPVNHYFTVIYDSSNLDVNEFPANDGSYTVRVSTIQEGQNVDTLFGLGGGEGAFQPDPDPTDLAYEYNEGDAGADPSRGNIMDGENTEFDIPGFHGAGGTFTGDDVILSSTGAYPFEDMCLRFQATNIDATVLGFELILTKIDGTTVSSGVQQISIPPGAITELLIE